MKKFLLSLAVLFAGMATAQTYYSAGEAVTEVAENEPFLLSCDAAGTRFLTNDGKNYLTSELPTDAALVEFEYANEDEDGNTFYFIKFSESGLYLADQAMWDGLDSSDMKQDGIDPWDPAPYMFVTDDVDLAAKWTILPAAARNKAAYKAEGYMENWRVWTGQGDGSGDEAVPYENAMVIMRDAISTAAPGVDSNAATHNPVYLATQSNTYSFFSPGYDTNSWFISYPEEMDEEALMYYWVDANFPDGIDGFLETAVGDRAGMYSAESIEGLKAASEAFYAYDESYEGDPAEILAALIAGKEALKINEVEEGYYYMTSKRGSYVAYDDNGNIVGKAGFVVPTEGEGEAAVPSVTVETSKYLWYYAAVAGKERTFTIKNFGSGKYGTAKNANGKIENNTTLTTGTDADEFIFEFVEGQYGTVYIYHKSATGTEDCAWNIFSGWAGTPVGNWGPARGDEGNYWYLTPVAADKVEGIQEEVAQYELNSRLQAVYDNAFENYMKGRSYKAPEGITGDGDFVDHGFVKLTEAVDTEGNPVQTINVTCNAPESNEGNILHLADNEYNTFFHSTWSAFNNSPKPHNLIVDLGATTELPAIAIKILKRNTGEFNANRAVTKWNVYGTNDDPYNEEVAANWTAEGTVSVDYSYDYLKVSGTDSTKVANGVGMGATGLSGAAYRYIRLDAVNNLNNEQNHFFAFSELGIWTATYDASTSLNTVVPADVLAALEAQMAAAKAQLDAKKATDAQITALQKALDEFLKNFPEPQRLVDAVEAAEVIAANLPTGGEDEVGFYPETAADEFAEIVEGVKSSIQEVMTLDQINAGIATIDAAKAALLKTLVMPASGYYQIRVDANNYKEAILHVGRNAADTKEQKGLRADFSKLVMQVNDGDTTYVDNANYAKSVSSIWYVKVGQDNKLSIRSLGNGLYLQPMQARSAKVQLTQNEAEIELQADGLINGEQYNFIVGADTASGKTLYFNINSTTSSTVGDLVAWDNAGGHDNSTFRLEPVDLADFTYGPNYFAVTAGANQFMTFPYDAKYYAQKAKVYEIAGYYADGEDKGIYFTPVAPGTTLIAGTPYLIKPEAGVNYFKTEFEQKTVSESDFNYSYEGKDVNGFVGTVFSTEVGPKFGQLGFGGMITSTSNTITDGKEVLTTIAPYSAYINGANMEILTEAPADAVMIPTKLDIDNLNAIDAVEVVEANKSGIYTISGVRLNSAKNLPAGIYVINGKKVVK